MTTEVVEVDVPTWPSVDTPPVPVELYLFGACNNTWVEAFYPPARNVPGDRNEGDLALARRICAGCEVLELCRNYAIPNERHGFWGGLTAGARRRIREGVNQHEAAQMEDPEDD